LACLSHFRWCPITLGSAQTGRKWVKIRVRIDNAGELGDGSDIDLLVDLPDEWSLVDIAGLKAEPSDLLGEDVDLATPDLLKPAYLKEALKEVATAAIFRR
jgi:hypothetical protein